jgi:hypothetical protein
VTARWVTSARVTHSVCGAPAFGPWTAVARGEVGPDRLPRDQAAVTDPLLLVAGDWPVRVGRGQLPYPPTGHRRGVAKRHHAAGDLGQMHHLDLGCIAHVWLPGRCRGERRHHPERSGDRADQSAHPIRYMVRRGSAWRGWATFTSDGMAGYLASNQWSVQQSCMHRQVWVRLLGCTCTLGQMTPVPGQPPRDRSCC